jgi:hypothetical protein
MPICNLCNEVVIALYPEHDISTIRVIYPRYSPEIERNCWMCAKHVDLLQWRHPEVYDRWLREPVRVVHSRQATTRVESKVGGDEPTQSPGTEPSGPDVKGMFIWRYIGDCLQWCEIELNFLTSEGKQCQDI